MAGEPSDANPEPREVVGKTVKVNKKLLDVIVEGVEVAASTPLYSFQLDKAVNQF